MRGAPEETPYLSLLRANRARLQAAIEELLGKYRVQPVGSGYIDLIVSRSAAAPLLAELERLPVAVESATWWCWVGDIDAAAGDSTGCPHGQGGPANRFGPGWFSECVHYPDWNAAATGIDLLDQDTEPLHLARRCNGALRDYLEHLLPHQPFYTPCLRPGLWLHVPDDWERVRYLVP